MLSKTNVAIEILRDSHQPIQNVHTLLCISILVFILILHAFSFAHAQVNDSVEKLEVIGIPERGPDFDGWYNMPFQITWSVPNIAQNSITCENSKMYTGPSGNNLELQAKCFDAMNNTGTGTFIFKYDSIKPQINPLRNIIGYSEDTEGKIIHYDLPDAADNLGGNVNVSCNPASGIIFEIGTTTVTCNAKDAADNLGSTTFSVNMKLLDEDVSF